MGLRELQSQFAKCLGQLLVHAFSLPGVELTLGEGFVSSGQGHMSGSLHYLRLAQDVNLFVDGAYISADHPVWHDLATYWKGLDALAAWGGDFQARDYNHFSLSYGGRK